MESNTQNRRNLLPYDSTFHAAIARATGNPTLVFLINALTDALAQSREHSFRPRFGPPPSRATGRSSPPSAPTTRKPPTKRCDATSTMWKP